METKVMGIQSEGRGRWNRLTRNPLFGLLIAIVCVIPFDLMSDFSVLSMVGILLVTWLAVENGGNDVSKGVAPLVSAGAVGEIGALIYGAIATAAGAFVSMYVSLKLLKLFTSGLIDPSHSVTGVMVLAMATGASLWVALATRYSWPVSTTHAIVGSILAVGCIAFGTSGVLWGSIVGKIVLPLLFSPVAGIVVGWALTFLIQILRIPASAGQVINWISSGAVCFVRAVNDTPKIVGIGVLMAYTSLKNANDGQVFAMFALIAVAMAVGSVLKGLNVLQLLAKKVAKNDPRGSLSAVVATAVLVLTSSQSGLPVSTTHVSTTAIIGAGLRQGKNSINWSVVRDMALSWVITLPAAGIFAAIVYLVAKFF